MPERILDLETREKIYHFVMEESHIKDNPYRRDISLGVSLFSENMHDRAVAERVILHYDHLAEESIALGCPWWYAASLLTLLEARNCDTGDEIASDPRSNAACVAVGRETGKDGLKKVKK